MTTKPHDGRAVSQTPQPTGSASQAAQPSASLSAGKSALLTPAQAAREVFGVSERTFHGLRKQPWMPKAVTLGPRLVRYVRSELEAACASMPRAVVAEPAQLSAGRAKLRAKVEAIRTGTSAGG